MANGQPEWAADLSTGRGGSGFRNAAQGARDLEKVGREKRLLKELNRRHPLAKFGCVDVRQASRQHDDRRLRKLRMLAHNLAKFHTAEQRHLVIGYDEMELRFLQEVPGLQPVLGPYSFEPGSIEREMEQHICRPFIVDDQNSFEHGRV